MSEQDDTPPVEETLAWEAEHGPRAAVAAVIAALATFVGGIISSTALSNQPHVPVVTALQNAAKPGSDQRPSLRTPQLEYVHDKAGKLILGGVILGIGYFALIPALGYLYRATKARRPQTPRAALYLALVGPALLGVAAIVFQIALTMKAGDFAASSDHTRKAVDDVTKAGLLRGVQILNLPGTLCLAFAFVMISLNAMRAGLLTRLLGMVGIGTGVFFILPLPLFGPLLQVLFQASLALLLFRAWMGGIPPAWNTGRAEPWPARQGASRRPAPRPEPTPQPAGPSEPRRKRKKRH